MDFIQTQALGPQISSGLIFLKLVLQHQYQNIHRLWWLLENSHWGSVGHLGEGLQPACQQLPSSKDPQPVLSLQQVPRRWSGMAEKGMRTFPKGPGRLFYKWKRGPERACTLPRSRSELRTASRLPGFQLEAFLLSATIKAASSSFLPSNSECLCPFGHWALGGTGCHSGHTPALFGLEGFAVGLAPD